MEQIPFNSEQLKVARIARGLSIKTLAEEAGISRQMVSNYESGKTVPGGANLLSLIKVLDFPYSFFTSESKKIYRGATYFRSQSASTKRSRDMQGIRLKFQYEIFNHLKQFVNFPEVVLPNVIEKDIQEISEIEIKEKAEKLRELWGIGQNAPINNLIEIAEIHGVIITESNMSEEKLDAVSEWIDDRPFIMLTDNGESAVRRRFNIAHELGHIILHGAVESIYDYGSREFKMLEEQAHLFASHFLLPDDAFTQSLISVKLDFYIELKKYWKVSIAAMVYKTGALGFINEDQKLYLNKKISSNKWRKKEPLDDMIPVEKPSLYNKVFLLIVDNNIVSQEDLISSLNLPFDEISKSVGIRHNKNSLEKLKPQLRVI